MISIEIISVSVGTIVLFSLIAYTIRSYFKNNMFPPTPPISSNSSEMSDDDGDLINDTSVNGLPCCTTVSVSSPICRHRKGCKLVEYFLGLLKYLNASSKR